MLHISVPQSAGFPMAWWLALFVIAFVVHALLGIWFWHAARRHDRAVLKDESHSAETSV